MTALDDTETIAQEVLASVRALAPTIASRVDEIEASRRLPRDLLDELARAGAFRLLLPRSHGGIGADLPSALPVYEALAHTDASVAWTVMIGGMSWCDLLGLPRSTFDALYAGRGDVVTAGAFSPSGSITAEGGTYRVTGRWAFASGCEHADVLYGNCLEGVVDGVPQLRIAVFPPDQVVIEDTWNAVGLRGTGSHHFRVDDLVVPAERTVALMDDDPCLDEPIAHLPPPMLGAPAIASVALGTAQAALDDILALSTDKTPLLDPAPLATNPRFHYELATLDTELRAARALLQAEAESAWSDNLHGAPLTLARRATTRAAAVWATARAVHIVDSAYRLGGGTAVYAGSPLQRRLRDVHTMSQHFLVKDDTLTTAGAILAGQDPAVLVF